METTVKTVDLLNDLIELNNDRVAGFEKVLADITDENADVKQLFQEYASQSREFSQQLTAIVAANAEEVDTGNSISGTLHRAWIDVKSLFGGSDRKSILAEAERGEDAIKKAYQTTLADSELSADVYQTVSTQATAINAAHDRIKALRDAA